MTYQVRWPLEYWKRCPRSRAYRVSRSAVCHVAEAERGHVSACRRLGRTRRTGSGGRMSCETWHALAASSISAARGTGSSLFCPLGRRSRQCPGKAPGAKGRSRFDVETCRPRSQYKVSRGLRQGNTRGFTALYRHDELSIVPPFSLYRPCQCVPSPSLSLGTC